MKEQLQSRETINAQTVEQATSKIVPSVAMIGRLISGKPGSREFLIGNPQLIHALQVIDHRLTWLERPQGVPPQIMLTHQGGFHDLLLRRGFLSNLILKPLLARFNRGRDQHPIGSPQRDYIVYGEESAEEITKRLTARRARNKPSFDSAMRDVERAWKDVKERLEGFLPELGRIGIHEPTEKELILAYTWYQHSTEPKAEPEIEEPAREREYYSAASRLVPDDGRRMMVQIAVDRSRGIAEPPHIFKAEDGKK